MTASENGRELEQRTLGQGKTNQSCESRSYLSRLAVVQRGYWQAMVYTWTMDWCRCGLDQMDKQLRLQEHGSWQSLQSIYYFNKTWLNIIKWRQSNSSEVISIIFLMANPYRPEVKSGQSMQLCVYLGPFCCMLACSDQILLLVGKQGPRVGEQKNIQPTVKDGYD